MLCVYLYVYLLEAENEQDDAGPSPSAEGLGQSSVKAEGDNNIELQTVRNVINSKNDSELKNRGSSLNVQEGKAEASGGDVWCSVCKGTRALMSFCPQTLEGSRGPHTTDKSVEFVSFDFFVIRKTQMKLYFIDFPLVFCC